ncbi:MAG: L-aspartate oxidase [Acidobacteriota bacterium]
MPAVACPSRTDFVVIGSGIAGLRAAIALSRAGSVWLLTKDRPEMSNTEHAQGGIAVALSEEDQVRIHYDDTLKAGDGLCDPRAVRTLVSEGPFHIRQLIRWGAAFDREGIQLSFTREAAHSRRRILHAGGDSTGKEIVRALLQKARATGRVHFYPFAYTVDLIAQSDRVVGVVYLDERRGRLATLAARAIVLATGGAGCLYRETTNPPVATGDGMAIAARAGAVMADLELVQFHPTSLFRPGVPRFLLSEACRGEGGYLLNASMRRFMHRYHPAKELAPRDVVSRAIVAELERTGTEHVYLDLRHLGADFVRKRFPQITRTCLAFGVDVTRDPIPVHPAAHYFMGGVATDTDGRTSVAGLYAAGEVACTGVHGANRLASNSLLEGLVFGARAGRVARHESGPAPRALPLPPLPFGGGDAPPRATLKTPAVRRRLREVLWDHAGIVRDAAGLGLARDEIASLRDRFRPRTLARTSVEALDMLDLARLVVDAAIARKESRGGHYRSDFPTRDDARFRKHSFQSLGQPLAFAWPLAKGLRDDR